MTFYIKIKLFMGKKKKEHRKRVAKRYELINAQKRKLEKAQEKFLKAQKKLKKLLKLI